MATAQSRFEGDCFFNGNLSARTFTLPAGTVSDPNVQPAAGIQASKLQQQHEPLVALCNYATAAFVVRLPLHCVFGATAEIQEFRVGCAVAAAPGSSITIDLKKNGSSILLAPITLDSTLGAYALRQPTGFSSANLVAGDVLEVAVLTVAGATPPQGVFAQVIVREDPN